MLIITLRTDKPEAELGLYEDKSQLAYQVWPAHRVLAETIHLKIQELLNKTGQTINSLEGIVIYQGPGSFTGLRIGFSVANTLADSLHIPIVATTGDDWLGAGLYKILKNEGQQIALPDYGVPPRTTQQKK